MSLSPRAVAREILLWLLTALAGLSACLGLWVCWLSGEVLPLAIGLIMLALIVLTRRWSRPGRAPGRYDDLARFAVALVVAVPAILLVWMVVSTIAGLLLDAGGGTGVSLVVAVTIVGAVAVLVLKRRAAPRS